MTGGDWFKWAALGIGIAWVMSLFRVLRAALVLGGIETFRTLALPASFVRFEVPAAIAFAVALYPMLRGDLRVSRVEGGILVAAYCAWLVFVLATGAH